MVLLGQTVAESVDFTVGMREAVGSHVGDASSKQDRFDTGLRVGCIVRAAPSVQSDSASAKACRVRTSAWASPCPRLCVPLSESLKYDPCQ